MSDNMNEPERITLNRGVLRWVSLGIGMIALLVFAIGMIVTAGSGLTMVTYIALAVGVLGVAGFVLIDPAAFTSMLMGRTGQFGLTTILLSVTVVAALIALYVVIVQLNPAPIDLTEGKEYTLSDTTVDLLQGLDQPVHAVAFYPEGAPRRDEADIWLQQYERESGGSFTYEFIDPDRSPAQAQAYGITSANVIVFEQGDKTAQTSALSERELTSAISRAMIGGRRQIYAITGHGERNFSGFEAADFSQVNTELTNANFAVTPLNLIEAGGVPDDADMLVIAGPTAQFTASEVDMLRTYLDGGGAALILSDPLAGGGSFGNGVTGVDISDDGTLVATAGSDGTARIWDMDGEELAVLRGHTSDVVDVAFLPGGDRVVTAGADGTVRVWDTQSGEQFATLEGETATVESVAASPDGRYIASAGENQAVNVWDAETYAPLDYSPLTVTAPLWAVTFSPDSSLLAAAGGTGGSDGPVYVWDAESGEQVFNQRVHGDLVLDLTFSPDSETLHSAAVDGTEGIIDVTTGEASTVSLFPDFGISSIAIAEDGTTAYGVGDGMVHIRPAGAADDSEDTILEGHTNVVWAVAMTPDGERVVSAGRDGEARIWDVASGETVAVLGGHAGNDPLLAYLESDWAIDAQDDLVVDLLGTQYGFDELTAVVINGYNGTSAITSSLVSSNRPAFFNVARSLVGTAGEGSPITQTTLVTTDMGTTAQGQPTVWGETTNPFTTGQLNYDEADIPAPLTLALSATNEDTGGRLVVFGDADFASNQSLQYTTSGNAPLFVNAANWLTEGEDALDLPAAVSETRTLDNPFSQPGLIITAIGVSCLIPLALAGGGAVMWGIRRRQR